MADHIYILYSEITGRKPSEEEIDILIATLNKESTFRLLSMINNFLALFPPDNKVNTEKYNYIQSFLTVNLFAEDLLETLKKFVKNIALVDRPMFHRQQVLLLMKKVLLIASDDCGINPDSSREGRNVIGKLCLMMSDFTVTPEQELKTQSSNPYNPEESERVLNELLAQMLATAELENPPELSLSLARNLEYLRISSENFPETFNGQTLSDLFQSLNQINFERFLQMIVGVYAAGATRKLEDLQLNPANFNISKSTYFSTLKYNEKEIENFYRLTTTDFTSLSLKLENNPLKDSLQMQYDFTVFRKHPLFHLSADTLTAVDYSFLLEKVSIGFYHTILNSLLENSINPESFFRHWGYVFEKYVNDIFSGVYPKLSNRFHPNTYYESKQEKEAFDGIVEYPNSLVVMQYKGGLLNTKAKYSGDVNILLGEMNEKFGTKQNKSGIKQLSLNIERLFNIDVRKRLEIRNLPFHNIKNIYPILIVNDVTLGFGLANWRLREWFTKEIKDRNIEEIISVKNLLVLTIEDLEMLVPYLEAGDFTLLEFLQFYSQLEYTRFAWLLIGEYWYEPKTTIVEVFSRFRKEKDVQFRPIEKLYNKWEGFLYEMTDLFKEPIEINEVG